MASSIRPQVQSAVNDVSKAKLSSEIMCVPFAPMVELPIDVL